MENTYKMTDRDISLMIHLRATNDAIFTGRRNSAMRGWRAIRKEMGIQSSLVSPRQLKKKWDNLKEKYRALKNPPVGMENVTRPSSWRWFHLMEKALSGDLAGTAAVVKPCLVDEDEDHKATLPPLTLPSSNAAFSGLRGDDSAPLEDDSMNEEVLELSVIEASGNVEAANTSVSPAKVVATRGDGNHVRSTECELTMMKSQPVINSSQTAVLYATLLPDCTSNVNKPSTSSGHTAKAATEVDDKLVELQREWQALEREQAEFDRELIALERDRELLNRDMASLERDRTALERDRASVERDRAAVERDQVNLDRDRACLDRDRAILDRDRAFLERDRVFLERAREDLEKELVRREKNGHRPEMATEREVVLQTKFFQRLMTADLDPDQLETRQRLVSLFQRLVEKL
ncbi:hypothetical protein ABVT39_017129 [Epinephelus coioides]